MTVKEKKVFNPVTITVESLEELQILWNCLNTPWNELHSSAEEIVGLDSLGNIAHRQMWCAIDDVTPKIHED